MRIYRKDVIDPSVKEIGESLDSSEASELLPYVLIKLRESYGGLLSCHEGYLKQQLNRNYPHRTPRLLKYQQSNVKALCLVIKAIDGIESTLPKLERGINDYATSRGCTGKRINYEDMKKKILEAKP